MTSLISNRLVIALMVTAVTFALVAIFAWPTPAQKSSIQPKITWSEKQIEIILSPGEGVSRALSFSSTIDLANIVIEPVPEIAGFLTSQPNSFATVSANQPQHVMFNFAIPAGTVLKTFEGTLHVKSGSQTIPLTMKIVIHVAGTGVAIFLPPDPGATGKATLQGVDADGDNVRDDIQRYIALTYADSEKIRAALTQTAHAFEQAIIGSQDQSSALTNLSGLARSQDCLFYVRGVRSGMTTLREFQANYLNTDLRSSRWLTANGLVGAQTFRLPDENDLKSSCSFDPDALRN